MPEYDLFVTQALAICSLITSIAAVVTIIIQLVKKAKTPNDVQNTRIAWCEDEIAKIKDNLKKDYDRFEEIEHGNRVLMTAILALLSHGIDGDNIDAMRTARDDLQQYLIRR